MFGLYRVFPCFFENTAETPETAKYQKACGERLEKRSLHPPPVPARDLPLGVLTLKYPLVRISGGVVGMQKLLYLQAKSRILLWFKNCW
jgi:hypothetical protein